jgi:hypothetical protein
LASRFGRAARHYLNNDDVSLQGIRPVKGSRRFYVDLAVVGSKSSLPHLLVNRFEHSRGLAGHKDFEMESMRIPALSLVEYRRLLGETLSNDGRDQTDSASMMERRQSSLRVMDSRVHKKATTRGPHIDSGPRRKLEAS